MPDRAGLWDWVLARDQATLLALLAFCAAHAVNAVQLPARARTRGPWVAAKQIAQAAGLDVTQFWSPTPASCLGRMKTRQVPDALREPVNPGDLDALAELKKRVGRGGRKAAAGTGWLPAVLKP